MAKKRANGEGNIKKRENGTWEARFSVNGKRHSIYGKTRAEVRKKLTDTLAKIDQEQFIEKTDMTVGEWLTIWQRDYIGNVKRGTAVNYELHLRLYILPVLSEVKLSDLKTPMIQKVYNSLINEKGLSPKTVKNAHGCLHKALSVAVKIGYIAKNPSEACILPKINQAEIQPFDTPEINKLLETVKGHEHEALIKTALFTGMRSGELCGLTWDCVDFNKGLIYVKKQLCPPRGIEKNFRFDTLKNGKPRTLAPAPFVMETLREHKKRQEQQKKAAGDLWDDLGFPDLVFTYPNGKHYSQSNVHKFFQNILKKAGLEHHRFHDLRHSSVTLLLAHGIPLKQIQEWLGHSDFATTANIYAHLDVKSKERSAAVMKEALRLDGGIGARKTARILDE